MRCRSTGTATFCTSSMATENRPSMAARALPPWIRNCPARGPAPQSTSSWTNFGAAGVLGPRRPHQPRHVLARCTRSPPPCRPGLAGSGSPCPRAPCGPPAFSPRVVVARIRSSSSADGIIDLDVEHEAVQLGLGQRIGPFLLDRVLRGDGEERLGQRIGLSGPRSLRAPASPATGRPGSWAACG